LVIAAAALRAGEYALVKGSIAGAIVTNTLFMLGASFLLGGLKHHVQEYNRATARLDAALLFLAAIALVSPSAIAKADLVPGTALTQKLSVALAVLLIVGYGLGLVFSRKTHREIFAGAEHGETSEPAWPVGLALVTLAVVTVLVALVSEVFVESVQKAAETFGMSQAFVGFIVVALVGAPSLIWSKLKARRCAAMSAFWDKTDIPFDRMKCPLVLSCSSLTFGLAHAAARFDHTYWRCGGLAACCARAAAKPAGNRFC
jgi:Ca2+:H+ antiporter